MRYAAYLMRHEIARLLPLPEGTKLAICNGRFVVSDDATSTSATETPAGENAPTTDAAANTTETTNANATTAADATTNAIKKTATSDASNTRKKTSRRRNQFKSNKYHKFILKNIFILNMYL